MYKLDRKITDMSKKSNKKHSNVFLSFSNLHEAAIICVTSTENWISGFLSYRGEGENHGKGFGEMNPKPAFLPVSRRASSNGRCR